MHETIPRRLCRPHPRAGRRWRRQADLGGGSRAARRRRRPGPAGPENRAAPVTFQDPPCRRCAKAERLRRRLRIEALLDAGLLSAAQIRDALAREGVVVSLRQVRADLRRVEAEWREAYLGRRVIWIVRLVRRAERRIAALQAEWQRSKQDRVVRRRKEVAARPGKAAGGRVETEVLVETRLGNPAYLTEALKNDEFVARLLGLFEPETLRLTEEDVEAEIERVLAELAERRQTAAAGMAAPAVGRARGPGGRPAAG